MAHYLVYKQNMQDPLVGNPTGEQAEAWDSRAGNPAMWTRVYVAADRLVKDEQAVVQEAYNQPGGGPGRYRVVRFDQGADYELGMALPDPSKVPTV